MSTRLPHVQWQLYGHQGAWFCICTYAVRIWGISMLGRIFYAGGGWETNIHPIVSGLMLHVFTLLQWMKILRYSALVAMSSILWTLALSLCGALRTILLWEHSEIALLAAVGAISTLSHEKVEEISPLLPLSSSPSLSSIINTFNVIK